MTYEPVKTGDTLYGIAYSWENQVTAVVVEKVSPKTLKVGRYQHSRLEAGEFGGAVSAHWKTYYYRTEREAILAEAEKREREAKKYEREATASRIRASEWRALLGEVTG